MRPPKYPASTVRALLNTNAVTPATAKALQDRLQKKETAPRFFDAYSYHLLSVVCDRLLGQLPENRLVPIAFFIDERLAAGLTDGWRYNHMPPDSKMYVLGLNGIDETAKLIYGTIFLESTQEEQISVLHLVQRGTAAGATWELISAITFFEELLAEATEIFYAHPLAQEEIGYVGMADAQGWQKTGMNEKEAIEPETF